MFVDSSFIIIYMRYHAFFHKGLTLEGVSGVASFITTEEQL